MKDSVSLSPPSDSLFAYLRGLALRRLAGAFRWPASSFFDECRDFYRLLCRHNASVATDDDIAKMQYTILRECHTIEKGLSMRTPRRGFGQEKVRALIARLARYEELYGARDRAFLQSPVDTIGAYIAFTEKSGVAIPDIVSSFGALCEKARVTPRESRGGVRVVTREEIQARAKADFASLLASRHSIRAFDRERPPTRRQIEDALELARLTPSACNRQAWHTHVFQGPRSVELATWQGGCRGFEDEMTTTILVTADLKGFFWNEVHQAYVDGGLYAMNLIHAIHALGMGSIPLSTGFERPKLAQLAAFGVPENEVPVVLIGLGNLLPECRVAVSERKPIGRTNLFHGDWT